MKRIFAAGVAVTTLLSSLTASAETISMDLQAQEQSNWCWISTARNLNVYYGENSRSQCQLANRIIPAQFDQPDLNCCAEASASAWPCNKTGSFGTPLAQGIYSGDSQSGLASYARIDREMGAKRPIVLNVKWTSGGSHYLIVHGSYDATGSVANRVKIWDPGSGRSTIMTWASASTYPGTSSRKSYFMAPPPPPPSNPACANGDLKQEACSSGLVGTGKLLECVNGRWVVTDNTCSRPGGPQPDPR